MNRSRVRDYYTADQWLQNAGRKDKTTRTLYEQGLKLVRIDADTISVTASWWGFNSGPVVSYKSDGTTILHPGRYYQSARRVYSEYVRDLVMVIRKGQVILSLPSDGMSPSKVTKCRACKGVGTFARQCYGPSNCRDSSCEQYQAYAVARAKCWEIQDWPEKSAALTKVEEELAHNHYEGKCAHGRLSDHLVQDDRYECWKCQGNKTYDYGNKRKGRVWDGKTQIGIDTNGNYIEV